MLNPQLIKGARTESRMQASRHFPLLTVMPDVGSTKLKASAPPCESRVLNNIGQRHGGLKSEYGKEKLSVKR